MVFPMVKRKCNIIINGMKNINLKSFQVHKTKNGFIDGIALKRRLNVRECKYILNALLGINISGRDDFDDDAEYQEWNTQLTDNVNAWLNGEADDSLIMEYAYDCSDEPLGLFNCISILEYLQKREII